MNFFTAIVTLALLRADTDATQTTSHHITQTTGAPKTCGPMKDNPYKNTCKNKADVCVGIGSTGFGECIACNKTCKEGEVCLLTAYFKSEDGTPPMKCFKCRCPTKGFKKQCSNAFNKLDSCIGKACKKDTDCGTEKTAACVNKLCKTCFMPCNETATCTAKNDHAKCEASNNPKPTTPKHAHGGSEGAKCSLMLFAAMMLTSLFRN